MAKFVDIGGTNTSAFKIGTATIVVDNETNTIESDIGFGFKNSGYVSNAILKLQNLLTHDGMTITLPKGMVCKISNSRDDYDEVKNPFGTGLLKSINVITTKDYTLDLEPITEGLVQELDVFLDYSEQELFVCESDKVTSDNRDTDLLMYNVWRDTSNNKFYRSINGSWVEHYIIKVGTFVLTGPSEITHFEPAHPIDLLKLEDFVNGVGGKIKMQRQSWEASSDPITSITLEGKPCKNINNLVILIEHTEIPVSAYTIDPTGFVVTFAEAVPSGLRIDARWF